MTGFVAMCFWWHSLLRPSSDDPPTLLPPGSSSYSLSDSSASPNDLMHTHTYTHTWMIYAHIHTPTRICRSTHIHTYIHTHTHKHTHSPSQLFLHLTSNLHLLLLHTLYLTCVLFTLLFTSSSICPLVPISQLTASHPRLSVSLSPSPHIYPPPHTYTSLPSVTELMPIAVQYIGRWGLYVRLQHILGDSLAYEAFENNKQAVELCAFVTSYSVVCFCFMVQLL